MDYSSKKIKFDWVKQGLIFNLQNQGLDWCVSHAQLPVADLLENGIARIYFAGRNVNSFSSIGFVEIDLNKNFQILNVSKQPVLSPGSIGHFDEHGVFPSSIVTVGDKKFLYYIGWNQGVRKPLFYASIGIAVSEDGGMSFRKMHSYPIMSRGEFDPCLVTSPNVFIEDNKWHMTYVSGERWEEINGSLCSFYNIKYAHSNDGFNWIRDGVICIGFRDSKETNIARSSVIKLDGIYRMWFCYVYNGQGYRIGYAESDNLIEWHRKDEDAGITISQNSFDANMICYPSVIRYNDKLYMFYNGDNYGKEGFGVAITDLK